MVDIKGLVAEVGKLHERAISLGILSERDTKHTMMIARIHGDWSKALSDDRNMEPFWGDLADGIIRLLDLAYIFKLEDLVSDGFEKQVTTDPDDFVDFKDSGVAFIVVVLHRYTSLLYWEDCGSIACELEDVAEAIASMLGLLHLWMNNCEACLDFEKAVRDQLEFRNMQFDEAERGNNPYVKGRIYVLTTSPIGSTKPDSVRIDDNFIKEKTVCAGHVFNIKGENAVCERHDWDDNTDRMMYEVAVRAESEDEARTKAYRLIAEYVNDNKERYVQVASATYYRHQRWGRNN